MPRWVTVISKEKMLCFITCVSRLLILVLLMMYIKTVNQELLLVLKVISLQSISTMILTRVTLGIFSLLVLSYSRCVLQIIHLELLKQVISTIKLLFNKLRSTGNSKKSRLELPNNISLMNIVNLSKL